MRADFSRVRPGFELGLAACVFLFLPVLTLASRGAAALAAVAGVLAFLLAVSSGGADWRGLRHTALLLAALVLWGLASAVWAIDPWRSVVVALRLTGLFAAGLTLIAAAETMAAPARLLRCLIAGLVVALGLTVIQFATGGALTGALFARFFIKPILNQAENGFVLLLLPLTAALVLRRHFLLAALLAVATVAVIDLLVGTAAKVAFTIGVGAALLLYLCGRRLAYAAAIGSIAVILTAPLTFPSLFRVDAVHQWAIGYYKSSARHRLEIWSFVGDRIAERPWLGWGLDASRAIPGGTEQLPDGLPGEQNLPLHPHNTPLQVWLELGVPGAALFAWFVARLWLALAAMPWPRLYRAAAGGSLAAVLTVAMGGYGIWQEWWIGTEALTLFVILVMGRVASEAEPAQPMPETRRGLSAM
jgi:O-antigen ligase